MNSFVVFEMSAEMNNKYDVGNFSKLLEEFSVEGEIEGIEKHLFGEKEAAPPV